MESKNIKVIDEHGIDRVANIISAVNVDGVDYVIYWIERDNDNDNIFVSRLMKNIDGTSNMVNIDDSSEKERMSEVVKSIIKYSIDNQENTLPSKTFSIPSGKEVTVMPVLFNKEQGINVQKTYITTVKKAVTKVCGEYYNIPKTEDVASSIFVDEEPFVAPQVPESQEFPEIANVQEEIPEVNEMEDTALGEEMVIPDSLNTVETPVVAESEPLVSAPPVIEEVIPSADVVSEPVPEPVIPVQPPVTPVAPVATSEPVAPTAPVDIHQEEVTDKRMVFDASKESSLNMALGEVTLDSTIPVENIQTVREFGADQPVQNEPVTTQEVSPPVAEEANTISKSAGFANNKFFMAIAVIFFFASCVFLGYEVFRFVQMK